MKIKYLKPMHNAHVGDVLDIPDGQAEFLIKAGIAETDTGRTETDETDEKTSIKKE